MHTGISIHNTSHGRLAFYAEGSNSVVLLDGEQAGTGTNNKPLDKTQENLFYNI